MQMKFLVVLLGVLPLAVAAASTPPQTPPNNNAPPVAGRPTPQNLQIPGPTIDDVNKAILELSDLINQFNLLAQPLMEPKHPYRDMVAELKAKNPNHLNAAKSTDDPVEALAIVKKVKGIVVASIKTLQLMKQTEPEAEKIFAEILQTKVCLEKRRAAWEQSAAAAFNGVQLMATGWLANFSAAKPPLEEARAACP